jgi:hypothetical protein
MSEERLHLLDHLIGLLGEPNHHCHLCEGEEE